jgi:uncharacterized protein (DUF488 family)
MPEGTAKRRSVIFTVGHSNRTLESFVRLLKAHGIERILDVRTIPRSRHNPQFNREALPHELRKKGIKYRNSSFRGYADYMQTAAFTKSLQRLVRLVREARSALMCAEAVPWRCHRSLIADALLIRGIRVEHITSGIRARTHALTPWAKVRGRQITYPEPSNDPG